jgi:hypothetical protein
MRRRHDCPPLMRHDRCRGDLRNELRGYEMGRRPLP